MTIQDASRRRLVIVGIDGLDPRLLGDWADVLPSFSDLKANGVVLPSRSVVPADSVPAWASIYSGLDPSEHGVLGSIDHLRGVHAPATLRARALQGKTFWDAVSRGGRKVCIVNPFLAYPAWPVNGVMVSGPALSSGKLTSFPQSLIEDYDVPELGGFPDLPWKVTLESILDHSRRETEKLLLFGIRLMEDFEWDLFFLCFLTLDRIQHFFWRFCDVRDPFYPGKSPFQDVIKEFYVLMDRAVGEFYRKTDSSAVFMVLSDHGHRRRPLKLVNFNELFRRNGLLVPSDSATSRLLEKTRSVVATGAQRVGAEHLLFRLARLVPKASEIRRSRLSIDDDGSIVNLSELAGISSFGGVCLNRTAIENLGLDESFVLRKLLEVLRSLKDPKTGRSPIREIWPRSKIYRGRYADEFPDVIVVLEKDYAVHWSIHDELIVPDYAHRLVSGGHSSDAVFVLSRWARPPLKSSIELIDIAPTVLRILGIPTDAAMQGQSLVE